MSAEMSSHSSVGGPSDHHQLHRFFREGFTAAEITAPLLSFDAETPGTLVGEHLERRRLDAVGVRIDGEVAGWAVREDLGDGPLLHALRSFFEAEVLTSRTPLASVISRLGEHPRVFVTAFGSVSGIITPADLQKAPVRMWLFGLITLVEEGFTRGIRERFPNETWIEHLSDGRVVLARKLHEERARRNESLDLVDCLQFGDKGTILFKVAEIRERMGFPSRTAARQAMRRLEALRNRLAHAQDLEPGLEFVVRLAEALDRVLEITES